MWLYRFQLRLRNSFIFIHSTDNLFFKAISIPTCFFRFETFLLFNASLFFSFLLATYFPYLVFSDLHNPFHELFGSLPSSNVMSCILLLQWKIFIHKKLYRQWMSCEWKVLYLFWDKAFLRWLCSRLIEHQPPDVFLVLGSTEHRKNCFHKVESRSHNYFKMTNNGWINNCEEGASIKHFEFGL